MTPTIKLFGMLLGLVVLAGCPDQSATTSPAWRYAVASYEETRPLPQTFADLVAFVKERHPDLVLGLNPPATKKQLDNLEALIGRPLPDDFRQLYRLANGQSGRETPLFPNGYRFLPLEAISHEWVMLKELHDEEQGFWQSDTPLGVVKDRWWDPAWIPFAQDMTGANYCIDLDPAPGGQVGQVIDHFPEDTDRPHLGFSLNDYLGAYEQGLRAGTHLLHAQWGVFTKVGGY